MSDRHTVRIDHQNQFIDVPGKVCGSDTRTLKTHKWSVRLHFILSISPRILMKHNLVRKYILTFWILQLPLFYGKLYRRLFVGSDQKLLQCHALIVAL